MNLAKITALITVCLGVLASSVLSTTATARTSSTTASPAYSLVGAWQVTVDPLPNPGGDQPPFESTLAFDKAMTVVEATSRAMSSAGLGAWRRTSEDSFRFVVQKYRFDATGAYVGKTVITEQVRMTGPDTYVGSALTKILTPGGTVVAQFTSESVGSKLRP